MKLLLVAWLFPPHENVGSRRPWRLCKHLPNHGWDITVLTQRHVPARFVDPTDADLGSAVQVVRDYDQPLLGRLAAWADARGNGAPSPRPEAPGRPSRWPAEPAAIHLPHAARAARDLHRKVGFDAVLTTSYPYSAHYVGAALSRALGVRWIADLRDPWTLHWSHEAKPAWSRALERRWERAIFAQADAVTVTTETLASRYRSVFSEYSQKIHAVRNSFDPVALPPLRPSRGPRRLVHFGHVYAGARTLAPVITALARVIRRKQLEPTDVVLENYGRFSQSDWQLAESLGIERYLKLHKPMPQNEGLASLRSANLLLLPIWGTAYGELFLPAKLYDYLLVGVPVLALGTHPELSQILGDTGAGELIAEDNTLAIEASIERALSDTDPVSASAPAIQSFGAPAMAERFNQLLRG
ncbi:MAG: glycosyltransferase [Deltaproteobacteria bacterium]|nr:glycosyltransferase [Deltaproteobacteria bacterium]